ncbi:hypothetical protein OO013_07790 [Mangrovivirga sp. M17]|uniref:DUF3575 domain-containing protein n=1 Tax=Mangrovivirga halotolerans TaxID=2993936 RepID=A0ABT3RQ53_9BACT|nr:hypothetical protein [Mangrovivirga halotolerans]MCX2743761.1 hypothetical protein [Mangrovivirga halotolerans]
MKKLILLIICFLPSTILLSQEVRLFTNAFRNVDLSHPQANLGVELKKEKNSISLTGGYFLYNFMFEEESNGFSIGTEYKLHKSNSFYYALNLEYSKINYETSNSFELDNDTSQIYSTYLDDYQIEKSRFDINTKIGYRIDIQRFYLDFFGGVGLRFKNTEHFERERPVDDFDPVFRLINIRDKEGKTITPILKLGIIIGIKINK